MLVPEDPKLAFDRQYEALERLVHDEVIKEEGSRYWRGLVSPPFASEEDFDRKKMVDDFALQFSRVSREAALAVVVREIHHYYLR